MLATTPSKATATATKSANAPGSAPGPRCHTCEKPVRGHRMMNRRRICPRDFDKYDALRGDLEAEEDEEEDHDEGQDQDQDDDASVPASHAVNLKREETVRPDVLLGGPPPSPSPLRDAPEHRPASKFEPSFVIPETGAWHRRNPNWVDKKPVLPPAAAAATSPSGHGSGLTRTTSLVPTEIVDPNDPGASAVRSARTSGVGVGVGVAGIRVKHEPHAHAEDMCMSDKLDARGGAEARAAAVVDVRAHAGRRAWRWRMIELVAAGMLGGWVVLNGSWMVSGVPACACRCAA